MLEDMDKKSAPRSVQAPSKGNGTDPKKQDVPPLTKQHPKWRKREPPNGNGSKFEQGKKPVPQKSKSLDKRPRSRGNYSGGRKEDALIVDQLQDELGFDFTEGKRRSLNHLLNFHCDRSRNVDVRHGSGSGGSWPTAPSSTKAMMATRTHKYNKEHFLQANCQFVVRSTGDYSPYLADPDLLVDWEKIELIRVASIDVVNCPICLYPPSAAKITRCGHIFCWPCILHYLALSDKSWRKCPICYEAVHKNNLKSVDWTQRPQYSAGKTIRMQLMKREKGTLIASPVDQHEQRILKQFLSLSESSIETCYSKLLLAEVSDINKIIDRERIDLEAQMEEFKGTPEVCFVEEAVELLAQRASLLSGVISPAEDIQAPNTGEASNSSSSPVAKEEEILESPIEFKEPLALATESAVSGSETSERQHTVSLSSDGDSENVSVSDLFIAPNTVKYYYFYQAEGGDPVYLHAMNVRMLESEYGSLESCPLTIEGKIVEVESGSMTTELRNRLRYLNHLPVTVQFDVVEIALTPPVVSPETLVKFQDHIDARKRSRAKRAREEKRRSKEIEAKERKILGAGYGPQPNLKIKSHFHFPQCGETLFSPTAEDFPTGPGSGTSSRASSPGRSHESSSLSSALSSLSLEPQSESGGPSFAQMLREGATVTKSGWPSIDSGWGGPSNSGSRKRQPSLSAIPDSELDASSPPSWPTFTIADALSMANQQAEVMEDTRSRKKKKKKQKVLFVTGMACGGT